MVGCPLHANISKTIPLFAYNAVSRASFLLNYNLIYLFESSQQDEELDFSLVGCVNIEFLFNFSGCFQ